jgi:hypothetical protein
VRPNHRRQFGEGPSTWSMTSTSTGPVCDSGLSPSCSCRAVVMDAGADGSDTATLRSHPPTRPPPGMRVPQGRHNVAHRGSGGRASREQGRSPGGATQCGRTIALNSAMAPPHDRSRAHPPGPFAIPARALAVPLPPPNHPARTQVILSGGCGFYLEPAKKTGRTFSRSAFWNVRPRSRRISLLFAFAASASPAA